MANTYQSDDDSISITSTVQSEDQDEYEVEDVLAESKLDDGNESAYFLVKWAGYPLERCTWEPKASFCDGQTLAEWEAKKEAIARGERKPFDVDALMEKINALEEAKAVRKRKRRARRRRLGIHFSPSSSEDSDGSQSLDDFIDDDFDERPATTKRMNPTNNKRRHSELDNGASSPNSLFDEVIDITASPGQSNQHGASTSHHSRIKKRRIEALSSSIRRQLSGTNSQGASSSKPSDRPKLTAQTPSSRLALSTLLASGDRAGAMTANSAPVAKTARRQGVGTRAQDQNVRATSPQAFRLLSIQRRHEKFNRRDRAPDISQLDLRRPSDWLDPRHLPISTPSGPARHSHEDSGSLFVEQDSPVLGHSTLHTDDRHPPQAIRSNTGSINGRPRDPNDVVSEAPLSRDIRPPLRTRPSFKKRLWNPREALVNLKLNNIESAVRLCAANGVNTMTIQSLVKIKADHQILIDFKDTCTAQEYDELCRKAYNMPYSYCWAVGYEDTTDALNEMVKYLRLHDVAALWHHPDDGAQLALVAYAAGSPSWGFLDSQYTVPPDKGLRIFARGTLPPLSSIKRSEPPLAKSPQQSQPQHLRKRTFSGPFDVAGHDTALASSPPLLAQPARLQQKDPLPRVSPNRDGMKSGLTKSAFETLGISFKDLSIVKKSKKAFDNARAYYLCFPDESKEVKEEFELTRQFLKMHGIKAIFTNRDPEDWEKFNATQCGTVIFHQDFINYEDLPQFNDILRQTFNIFNISLGRPIAGTDNCHLQRLFPRGGVILITDDFIIRETSVALKVMEWFKKLIVMSPDWKMFFRPNIQQWLFELSDTWKDDKIFQIYCYIKALTPPYPSNHVNYRKRPESPESLDGLTDDEGQHHPFISPRSIRNYNERSESEHPAIPKGLSQEQRDTDHLIEYFAGWTLANCHKYRKLYVLTHFKPQPRWEKWHHLTIMNGEKFLKQLSPQARKSSGNARHDPRRNSTKPAAAAASAASQPSPVQSPSAVYKPTVQASASRMPPPRHPLPSRPVVRPPLPTSGPSRRK